MANNPMIADVFATFIACEFLAWDSNEGEYYPEYEARTMWEYWDFRREMEAKEREGKIESWMENWIK